MKTDEKMAILHMEVIIKWTENIKNTVLLINLLDAIENPDYRVFFQKMVFPLLLAWHFRR